MKETFRDEELLKELNEVQIKNKKSLENESQDNNNNEKIKIFYID